MAHRYESTLLSQLGFADPDKQEPLHDLACEYMKSDVVVEALMKRFQPKDLCYPDRRMKRNVRLVHTPTDDIVTPQRERVLKKGKGDYLFFIGFLDVVVPLKYRWEKLESDPETGKVHRRLQGEESVPLVIEVKVNPVEVGQILRQFEVYRATITNFQETTLEDLCDCKYVLVTCYALDPDETAALSCQDIWPIRLGAGFERYVSEQKKRAGTGEFFMEL